MKKIIVSIKVAIKYLYRVTFSIIKYFFFELVQMLGLYRELPKELKNKRLVSPAEVEASTTSGGKGSVSKIEVKWLNEVGVAYRQWPIAFEGRYYICDGFDPETNTVYEFLGTMVHGRLSVYSPREINPLNGKFMGDLYLKTMERFEDLIRHGYRVKYVWEDDYKKGRELVREYEIGKMV